MRNRRWMVSAAAICVAASALAAQVPAVVSGKVFLDANGNGKFDPGETPMPGVRVTDSLSFVTTGADGSYSITIGADPVIKYKGAQVVSVCWPSQTWPVGPWWARLDQIKDAAHVDFALRPDKQSLPFAFLHISDDHGSGGSYPIIGARVKASAGPAGPLKLCFNTGDMGYAGVAGADAMFSGIVANAQKVPVPMFFAPGNHDMCKEQPSDSGPLAGAGGYTKYLGPIRWSFDYAGVHFACIDWWDPDIKVHVEGSAPPIAPAWLDKDLSAVPADVRKILLIHFPSGGEDFYNVVNKHKMTFAFGGHNHRHTFYDLGGVPAVTTVNPEPGGSGNFGIVTKDSFDVAFVCGGKGGPGRHGKLCGLSSVFTCKEVPPVTGQPGKSQTLTGEAVAGAKALDVGPAQGVTVTAEFAPGTARRCGFKLGPAGYEVVYTGVAIEVGGAPIPFALEPGEDAVRLQFTVAGGLMTLQANGRVRMAWPKKVKIDNPAAVSLFAEGGQAQFKSVTATALK